MSTAGQEEMQDVFVIPASFAQKRLWFFDQFESDSVAYNIPTVFQMRGTLDRAVLEACLQEIVSRHETLRTTFATEEEEPVQVIHPSMHLPLPVLDLSELSAEEREREFKRFCHEEAHTPFDLGQGPLIRTHLIKLSENEHGLMVNMHHIISDGWSLSVFIREVGALYHAAVTGTESTVPELPLQYADYSLWQQELMQSEEMAEQVAYWKQQLSGTLPIVTLPSDFPRPEVQTYRGLTRKLFLARDLSDRVIQLCHREGVTPYMMFLTAFKTLLYRYTGLEDVIVGSPIAGRNQEEIEGLIGFFVNTLVLRTDLNGKPSFREALSRVREVSLGAYGHQDVPFEKLVEELQPERNTGVSPLIQVMFSYMNDPVDTISCGELTIEPLLFDHDSAKFDLTLGVTDTDAGLELTWNWNTDLFAEASMENLNKRFITLLESITAHPECSIAELELLTPAEREQALFGWQEQKANFLQQRYLLTDEWVGGNLSERLQVYILDSGLQPVPQGMAGDLYLAASGVTLGDLEALPNPFVADQLLYKTGERAFFRGDGSVVLVEQVASSTKQVKKKRPSLPAQYVAASSMVEEILTDIWEDVLGIEGIGVQDDFALLGGHLLFAPQIMARVEETLELGLPSHVLYETKTIVKLAEQIESYMQLDLHKRITSYESLGRPLTNTFQL